MLISRLAMSQEQADRIGELEEKIKGRVRDTAYVNTLNELALQYYSANPEKTKVYGALARHLADSLKYERGLADAYFSISLISKLKGDYTDELNYHINSLKIYGAEYDTNRIARTYDAMGAAYTQLLDFSSAREAHQKAMELFKATHHQRGFAMALRRIGNIELDNRNFKKALQYYMQALENERATNNDAGIASCLNNIGVTYYELKKYDSALTCYRESLAIITRINNVNRLPAAYHNLSRVYLDQGKVDEALAWAQKGLPIALKIGSRPAQRESYKLHADIFEQKGDFKKAYQYHLRYSEIKDSIINQENTLQFAKLHSVYRLEEKEKEIALLKKNQELSNVLQRITVGGLVVFVLVAGLIIYFQRNRILHKKKSLELVEQHSKFVQHVNEELRTNLEEIEAKNKEIVALAGHLEQVNLTKDKLFSIIGHDLRSPIQTLQGLLSLVTSDTITKEEFFKFSSKLKDGVEYYKFTLDNLLQWAKSQMEGFQTNPQKIDMHALANQTINFLMKNAKDKNIELCNHIDLSVRILADKDQLDIVVRNLISNAIKFTPCEGKITLHCKPTPDNVAVIAIADTGIGMDSEIMDKVFKKNIHVTSRGTQGEIGSGLGLLLCQEMIEKNQGKIWIESKPGSGTTFYVQLPRA
ncbi:MAG: tetratricopeptide repeat-containing sensor histidine kinase [Bacteroidota bacterium]